jgi:hypothetical protein
MTLELGALSFDADSPAVLAQFWAELLRREWRFGRVLPDVAVVDGAPGWPALLFLPVPEPKTAKNRCHPDLHTTDLATEVARAVSLGARQVARHADPSEWVVLIDPEGNEFCIVHDPSLDTR